MSKKEIKLKKKYKTNIGFLRDLIHHLEGDIDGFKDEIKEDKDLIKAARKKKATPKKIKKHLKSDLKFYKKEANEDRKLLKRMKKESL